MSAYLRNEDFGVAFFLGKFYYVLIKKKNEWPARFSWLLLELRKSREGHRCTILTDKATKLSCYNLNGGCCVLLLVRFLF